MTVRGWPGPSNMLLRHLLGATYAAWRGERFAIGQLCSSLHPGLPEPSRLLLVYSMLAALYRPLPVQEYRRQYNLEPLVKDEGELRETGRVRATVSLPAAFRTALQVAITRPALPASGEQLRARSSQSTKGPWLRHRGAPSSNIDRTPVVPARRWTRSARSAATRAWSSTPCSCAAPTRGRLYSTSAQIASTSTPQTHRPGLVYVSAAVFSVQPPLLCSL